MFCADLQNILKPIYKLTRKARLFMWTKMHHKAFGDIKNGLVRAPI